MSHNEKTPYGASRSRGGDRLMMAAETPTQGTQMTLDNSFCQIHDVYGKAVYAAISDDVVVNYFSHNNQLIISTYNRRTTVTTEETSVLLAFLGVRPRETGQWPTLQNLTVGS